MMDIHVQAAASRALGFIVLAKVVVCQGAIKISFRVIRWTQPNQFARHIRQFRPPPFERENVGQQPVRAVEIRIGGHGALVAALGLGALVSE